MLENPSMDQAKRAWGALRERLDTVRRETGAELLAYPQPTTECDLHYRDLLERRRRVNEALAELDGHPPIHGGDEAWLAWFTDFCRFSPFAAEQPSPTNREAHRAGA